jgi:hypothetical protein
MSRIPENARLSPLPVWQRLHRPAILSRARIPARNHSNSCSTKSPTTVTPRLTCIQVRRRSVSSASSCIASRDSQKFPGRGGFRRMFQRGRSRLKALHGHVFLQSSAEILSEPVTSAGCASKRTCRTQARLNSRNRLIITTTLHIVNHSTPHRTTEGEIAATLLFFPPKFLAAPFRFHGPATHSCNLS